MDARSLLRWVAALLPAVALVVTVLAASAAELPPAKEGGWVARDFRFHTGEVMPELRLHYRTLGDPANPAVLVLHGTAGTGASMMSAPFAGEMYGPGQPLDATKYFLILPDAIGVGGSSKPSNGMRARFPAYDYDDMVLAQYRLVTEGLGVRHLRLVIGNSMGGMHAWVWGVRHPDFMDALVPMASQPTAMSGRNWMLRRMLVETIRSDPEYRGGDYAEQPRSLRVANAFFGLATSGGTLALQAAGATGAAADRYVDAQMAQPFSLDANDYLFQWNSSRGYDPSAGLERIQAAVLAINSADDERNPPETGLMEGAMRRIPNAGILLIPASPDTRGHGTTGNARFYARELGELLRSVPHRAM